MRATSTAFLLILAFGAFGCGGKFERPHATDADSDSDTDSDTDADSDADAGIPVPVLTLTRVEPTHGPWTGGNSVEVRGNGFRGPFFVGQIAMFVDGLRVDPLDVEIVSPQSLRVLVGPRNLGMPAGDVGPADIEVRFAEIGKEAACFADADACDERAILPGGGDFGYTYDAFYVEPPRGTIGGGTRVNLYGSETIWDAASVVTFDGAEATDCTVLGATQIECKTPPGEPGDADVRVDDGSGEVRYADLVEDGYVYYNSADPIGGGLGGGPLDGQLNVTVLDYLSLLPVEAAFVIVGTDGGTEHQGLTNALGQITFVGDDLVGRQQVAAGKEGYESTSFDEFDARDVTILLVPIPNPNPGPPPPGRFPATIDGVLVFDGPNEFGPNPWIIIPDPVDPDEYKVCYVATTQSDIFRENINPGSGRRVLEIDPLREPENDYRYQIVARPAAIAVWAICGLENGRILDRVLADDNTQNDDDAFIPYAMGVRRNVLAGPGDIIEDADIEVNIPLDHLTIAQLGPTPPELDHGPNRYRTDVYVDLGGEGVIARDDKSIVSLDSGSDFRFGAQPPLMGSIADAQFTLVGGAYTWNGADFVNPFSVVIDKGIVDTEDPLLIDEFLGIANMIDPPYGGTLENRTITWEAPGSIPTFNMLLVQTLDQSPLWRVFVRGDVTTVELPDLAAFAGLPEEPEGYLVSIVWSIRVPDLAYDEFSYAYLSNNLWRAYAADAFLFEYP